MIRLLGAALVVAAGAGVGWQLAGTLARRPRELRELQGALALLATEIGYAATALPVALRQAAAAGPAAARLFAPLAQALGAGTVTVGAALTGALRRFGEVSALRSEDLEPLLALATVLGTSDRQDQCRHLELARQRLAVLEAGAESDRVRFERMYRYLGVLAGMALAILLA